MGGLYTRTQIKTDSYSPSWADDSLDNAINYPPDAVNRSHPRKLCSTCAYTYRPPNLLTVNDEGRVPSLHKIHPASSINLSRLFGFPLSLPPTIRRNSSTSPNYTTEISSPPKLSSTPLHRGVHHTRGAAFTISGAPVASAIPSLRTSTSPYGHHMERCWAKKKKTTFDTDRLEA